jgi:TonB family protein
MPRILVRARLQLVITAFMFCNACLYAQNVGLTRETSPQIPYREPPRCQHSLEILSPALGVNFDHYSAHILKMIHKQWYKAIPDVARPPAAKAGTVVIKFAVKKNGQIDGLQIVSGSGDDALDRAVLVGITASVPFPSLPSKFEGEYLALRLCFSYNPYKSSTVTP